MFDEFCNRVTPFQAASGLCLLILFLLFLYLKDMNLPPGPTGLPIFGYYPFLKRDSSYIQMAKLAEKYGDVFSFRSAGKLYIHLGSIKAIREAHITKSDCFEGRFCDFCLLLLMFQDGVGFVNGESWKVQRKFLVQAFKEYGMNATNDKFTGVFQDILEETIDELYEMDGRPVKITDIATTKCTAVIRRILFNDQCITEEEIKEINDQFHIVLTCMENTEFFLIGNIAKYLIFPFMPSFWTLKKSFNKIKNILYEIFKKQKATYDETNITNIIDAFFKERDERRRRGDPAAKYFTDKALFSSLLQFLTDGTSSIGLFIGMLLMSLADHPEEQEKVYEEIVEVIGSDRLPVIEDKVKLPYTNAFIYEVMRLSDLFTLFPSLQCSKETTLNGYTIPEGSITVLNLYAAHRNPEVYHDPEVFKPSRYFTAPGIPKPDIPIIFGVGKRTCIGEAFTMNQSFLFFTALVQKFHIAYPEGSEGLSNLFWSQEKLEIRAIPRATKQ